jgi:hypothetical protein
MEAQGDLCNLREELEQVKVKWAEEKLALMQQSILRLQDAVSLLQDQKLVCQHGHDNPTMVNKDEDELVEVQVEQEEVEVTAVELGKSECGTTPDVQVVYKLVLVEELQYLSPEL